MIDSERDSAPGSRDVADVLRSDPIFALLGLRLTHPIVLGAVLFLIAVAMIVLGPASESRFIYTDF